MPKEAYWFRHDCNARSDHKILSLRAEKGWEGYGIFWALIEMLSEATAYKLPLNKCSALAIHLGVEKEKLYSIIEFCCSDECRLFIKDETHFWSKSLKNRMKRKDEIRKQNSEAGRVSGIKRRAYALNGRSTSVGTSVEPLDDMNEMNDIIHSQTNKEGLPPDFSFVKNHFLEFRTDLRNPEAEALRFWNHYRSNGGINGNGQPIVNWQALAMNWTTKRK